MSIEWDQYGEKIFSGSIDKKLKQWDKNLDDIRENRMPVSIRFLKCCY